MNAQRKRKSRSMRMDTVVWDALEEKVTEEGIGVSRFVELMLFDILQKEGFIPKNINKLGETRGGDRSKQTKEVE